MNPAMTGALLSKLLTLPMLKASGIFHTSTTTHHPTCDCNYGVSDVEKSPFLHDGVLKKHRFELPPQIPKDRRCRHLNLGKMES